MLDGKIYSIVCKTTGMHYVGSTCSTLQKRLKGHERDYPLKKCIELKKNLDNGPGPLSEFRKFLVHPPTHKVPGILFKIILNGPWYFMQ